MQSKLFGAAGYNYMSWAAKMAVDLGTGVPWVMCKEEDAPDPVVSPVDYFSCKYKFLSTLLCNLISSPKRVIHSFAF